MKRVVFCMLIGLMSLTGVQDMLFAQSRDKPGVPSSSIDELRKQLGKREHQELLLEGQIQDLTAATRPIEEKLKVLDEEEQPLRSEATNLEKKLQQYNTRVKDHETRCHNGTLESQAYGNCIDEHDKIRKEAVALKKAWDDNDTKLKPYKDRRMRLGDEFEPLDSQFQARALQLTAIRKEIQRLQIVIDKYGECNPIVERCKRGDCSPEDLESWVHCNSMMFDGAIPNLPPLDWAPAPLRITANSK